MPVVFDEVIASVEAPPSAEADEAEAPKRDDSAEKAIVALETHQRRSLRLEAN